jgi:hypothetical protein
MVLPFENTSDKPEFNWVGESFALSLSSFEGSGAECNFEQRAKGDPAAFANSAYESSQPCDIFEARSRERSDASRVRESTTSFRHRATRPRLSI